MSKLTPAIQAQLYAETDARFWAQTGYKPGQKLDPKNPIDRKMIATYTDVYNKVFKQWQGGVIAWTHANPLIELELANAAAATAATVASMERAAAALAAGKKQEAAAHLADAQISHTTAAIATKEAAKNQPPTVSHAHVATAAHQIRQFVMNASGMGTPVGNGSDMTSVIQATSAPAHAAIAAPGDGSSPVTDLALPTFPDAPLHVPKHGVSGTAAIAIGVGVLAACGLAMFASQRSGGGGSRRAPRRSSAPRPVYAESTDAWHRRLS